MAQLQKPKIKNPELVAAMADFKQNQNKQTEAAMLEALKNASFIAPISLRTNLDEVTPDENGNRQVEASLPPFPTRPAPSCFRHSRTGWNS